MTSRKPAKDKDAAKDKPIGKWIGLGVGAGIGSAAIAAALIYANRPKKDDPTPKGPKSDTE